MLEALAWAGVRRSVLVVGHCADQVRQAAGERVGRMAIDYVVNPEYTRGSVLSLYAARHYLREPALVMDADVLFPREFLRRLLAGPAPSALLLDRGFADTGEGVKVSERGARGRRAAAARLPRDRRRRARRRPHGVRAGHPA